MTSALLIAAGIYSVTLGLHFGSIGVAVVRCRARKDHVSRPADAPAVSLVRPLCGLDNYVEETLASSFELDYPDYELIFCVAQARDPVVPIVRRLMEQHPHVPAKLLIGDERISANPKLNNCVKGWSAAAHEWIVLADSNVLMPRDYITRVMQAWRDDTGLVCSPPSGTRPDGFWAEVECAFLNAHEARWQYVADTLGFGFAQGKTMLWRRDVLDDAGGIRALAREVAEDAASTKVVRAAGLRVRLVDAPFAQPLGRRGAKEIWRRQTRWAQLRRASFPLLYTPEILSGAQWTVVAGCVTAFYAQWPMAPIAIATLIAWYSAEMLLARAAGWPVSRSYPIYAMTRDFMLPILWICGWLGSDFVWRGNAMSSAAPGEAHRT